MYFNIGIAQNLVSNSGFELTNTCNVGTIEDGMQNSIVDWFTYDYNENSPDVFNYCYTLPVLIPPNTAGGFSTPFLGNAMIGLAYYPTPDHVEAISIKLSDTLAKDSAYCVSFFVKNSAYGSKYYWTTNLGAYFSDDTIDNQFIRNNSPQISTETQLSENNWSEIYGYYIATGNESYLNLGYFIRYPNYFHESIYPDDFIYYFVDEVSVIQCNKDSLLSVVLELPNIFTPDGNFANDSYKIKNNNIKTMKVFILNRWGNLILEYDGLINSWDGMDANGNMVDEGVYFVKVIAETSFGELLSKQEFVHLIR